MELFVDRTKIARIQLYVNYGKKSLSQIMRETGADIGFNGGLYNMSTFKPVCHLKVDGNVLAADQYGYWGYAWNNPKDLCMAVDYKSFSNYLCCVCLVKDGKRQTFGNNLGGVRGRTGWGRDKNGHFWIYCSKDGTSAAKSPKTLQDWAINKGLTEFIMLDGGGSSQLYSGGSLRISTSRKVHNFVLIYLEGNGNIETETPKGTQYKTTAALNLRSSAGVTAKNKLYTLPYGTSVLVESVSNGWAKLSSPKGYVSAKYLTKVQESPSYTKGTCTANSVRVRSTPTTAVSNNIMGFVNRGQILKVYGKEGAFFKIAWNNGYAYVSTLYVKT